MKKGKTIDRETVNKIYEAANIVEVVSDFVNLKKSGEIYIGCCPFHNGETPSFTVLPAKNIYKCFGCLKGGNSVNFVMEHEQMSYREALVYLANKYHIEINEQEVTPEEREFYLSRENMLALNKFAKNTFVSNLFETEEGRTIGYKYFRERGFSDETIKTYELGYSLPDSSAFTDSALKSGYKQEYLLSTGLSVRHDDGSITDRFCGHVLFPIHNVEGRVIGFCGRVLNKDTKMLLKYKDSPQSEIYDKSRSLYGIYQAKTSIARNDKCFLVEGCTDVLSLHQNGIENVVASLGTALTIHQIRLIKKFTNNITLFYDGDAAGIHATLRAIDMILAEDMNAKMVPLPDDEDPDSFARKHIEPEIEEFITKNETDCLLFRTRLLLDGADNDPIKKANAIKDIAASISVIPDDIKRIVYAKECAKLIGIDEKVLNNEIDKRRKS